jgi:hypothetical protein
VGGNLDATATAAQKSTKITGRLVIHRTANAGLILIGD